MPIVIPRTGDTAPKISAISQEQRDALWAAIVKNWTERNPELFKELISAPAGKSE